MTTTQKLTLAKEWKERCELYRKAWKLHAEGHKLHAEGDKLHAEGHKQYAEGNKLRAEGHKLCVEGEKLRAEGNLLFTNAILSTFGNIELEWKNWNKEKCSYECHLGNGEVYIP